MLLMSSSCYVAGLQFELGLNFEPLSSTSPVVLSVQR